MFKRDVNEISFDVLNKIKSEKVLEKEHDHINKLIQQHDTGVEKTLLWLFGIILASLGIGIGIKYIIDFSITLLDNPSKYSSADIKEAVPWALNFAIYLGGGAILFILILLVVKNYIYRKSLIVRKEKIIELLTNKFNTEGK